MTTRRLGRRRTVIVHDLPSWGFGNNTMIEVTRPGERGELFVIEHIDHERNELHVRRVIMGERAHARRLRGRLAAAVRAARRHHDDPTPTSEGNE